MDVLARAVVAGLERSLWPQHVVQGDAGFQTLGAEKGLDHVAAGKHRGVDDARGRGVARVGVLVDGARPEVGKPAVAQAHGGAQALGQLPVVAEVQRRLVGVFLAQRDVKGTRDLARRKHVVGVLHPPIQLVPRVGVVRPAQIGDRVLNARIEFERGHGVLGRSERVGVVGIHRRGVEKQLGIHAAVPAEGRRPVAPAKVKQVLGAELVAAKVHARKDAVLVAERGVHLGVDVVEVE